jgi:hypothetical protein
MYVDFPSKEEYTSNLTLGAFLDLTLFMTFTFGLWKLANLIPCSRVYLNCMKRPGKAGWIDRAIRVQNIGVSSSKRLSILSVDSLKVFQQISFRVKCHGGHWQFST